MPSLADAGQRVIGVFDVEFLLSIHRQQTLPDRLPILRGPLSDRVFAMIRREVQDAMDRSAGLARPLVTLTIGGGPGTGGDAAGVIRKKPKPRKRGAHGGAAASGDAVTAPMQGTVVKVAVEEGQEVSTGDLVAVLEAMKMENPVTAHKDGVITGLAVETGAAITQGTVLAEIK